MKSTLNNLFKLSKKVSLEFSVDSKKKSILGSQAVISKFINGILKDNELKLFMLAVDEVLQNAYEHGNLGICHDTKNKLLDEDRLDSELKILEDLHGDKQILIEIKFLNKELSLSVEDQGEGFDWQELILKERDNTALHGRGLKIIQAASDKLEFNHKGNKITLIKVIN